MFVSLFQFFFGLFYLIIPKHKKDRISRFRLILVSLNQIILLYIGSYKDLMMLQISYLGKALHSFYLFVNINELYQQGPFQLLILLFYLFGDHLMI